MSVRFVPVSLGLVAAFAATPARAQIFQLVHTDDMAFERLTDINPGSASSVYSPHRMPVIAYDGDLYFTVQDATHGRELWRLDPTNGIASIVVDHAPGTASGLFWPFDGWGAVHAGKLYLTANDPSGDPQLYAWDGSQLALAAPWAPSGSYYSGLTSHDGDLYLTPTSSLTPEYGYRLDGTSLATYGPFATYQNGPWQRQVAAEVDGGLIFRDVGDTGGVGGTTLQGWDGQQVTWLAEYPFDNGNPTVSGLFSFGTYAYFVTTYAVQGQWQSQLLRTDGTSVQTVSPPFSYPLTSLVPTARNIDRLGSAWLLNMDHHFFRYHPSTGWTDLTSTLPTGTTHVHRCTTFASGGTSVIFAELTDAQGDVRLGVFDGTAWEVHDIGASDASAGVQVGDSMYFRANTSQHGGELWRMYAAETWHWWGEWNPEWENTTEWPMDEEVVLGVYLIDPEADPILVQRTEAELVERLAASRIDLYPGEGALPDVAGLVVVAFSNESEDLITSELHVLSDPDGTGEATLRELADGLVAEVDLATLLEG